MKITRRDDDIVRTHDEAAQLLRYAAPGATVVIERIEREHMPNARRFTIVLDAAPHHATSAAEIYTLPCRGEPIQRRVGALCREAWEALRTHRRTA